MLEFVGSLHFLIVVANFAIFFVIGIAKQSDLRNWFEIVE